MTQQVLAGCKFEVSVFEHSSGLSIIALEIDLQTDVVEKRSVAQAHTARTYGSSSCDSSQEMVRGGSSSARITAEGDFDQTLNHRKRQKYVLRIPPLKIDALRPLAIMDTVEKVLHCPHDSDCFFVRCGSTVC